VFKQLECQEFSVTNCQGRLCMKIFMATDSVNDLTGVNAFINSFACWQEALLGKCLHVSSRKHCHL